MWNFVPEIWNQLSWNSEFGTWILESTEWNPESMTVLNFLTWGKTYLLYTQRSFCAGPSLSSKCRQSYIKQNTPLYYLLFVL